MQEARGGSGFRPESEWLVMQLDEGNQTCTSMECRFRSGGIHSLTFKVTLLQSAGSIRESSSTNNYPKAALGLENL